jgi:HSP20 family molecular chaperone IbpA
MSLLSSPMLLGFDEIERLVDRVAKGGADGYPPDNIERIAKGETSAETLRSTLAVAGFTREQIEITLADNQLSIRGKQEEDRTRKYLHRGIAARQFQRTFVLAEGIEVRNADLNNGLLSIDLVRHTPERLIRRIEIGRKSAG